MYAESSALSFLCLKGPTDILRVLFSLFLICRNILS